MEGFAYSNLSRSVDVSVSCVLYYGYPAEEMLRSNDPANSPASAAKKFTSTEQRNGLFPVILKRSKKLVTSVIECQKIVNLVTYYYHVGEFFKDLYNNF